MSPSTLANISTLSKKWTSILQMSSAWNAGPPRWSSCVDWHVDISLITNAWRTTLSRRNTIVQKTVHSFWRDTRTSGKRRRKIKLREIRNISTFLLSSIFLISRNIEKLTTSSAIFLRNRPWHRYSHQGIRQPKGGTTKSEIALPATWSDSQDLPPHAKTVDRLKDRNHKPTGNRYGSGMSVPQREESRRIGENNKGQMCH